MAKTGRLPIKATPRNVVATGSKNEQVASFAEPEIQITKVKKIVEPTVLQFTKKPERAPNRAKPINSPAPNRNGDNSHGAGPSPEILLPRVTKSRQRRTLRTAEKIAEYYYGSAEFARQIYDLCADGAFPHWKDKGILCADTRILDLWKLVRQVYNMLRLRFTREDALVCLPIFVLAMHDDDLDPHEIMNQIRILALAKLREHEK